MRKYPVGIQDLSEVVNGGYVYVDKTQHAYDLIMKGKFYFLSRPRRFGKSLFISLLYYLFIGKKEIFKGLFIEDKWDWSKISPVIRIGFSSIGYNEIGLSTAIEKSLNETAKQYKIEIESTGISQIFKELIQKLDKTYGSVVVLIDEYDKPIIDFIDGDILKAIENRNILKSFYSILKDSDPHLKFVFITGVSKFSKVSIFSDLNNLNDLTLDEGYSSICGITEEELELYFAEELEKYDSEEIKRWYNGYHWKQGESVYNPFSLVNFFLKNGVFKNYWFATGTPTFLMNLAKKEKLFDFEGLVIDEFQIETYDIEKLSLVPLMHQTGYLTIKNKDEFGNYELGYPNEEVRKSFVNFLASAYSDSNTVQVLATQMYSALRELNFDKVQSIFNTIFKSIPYEIWQKENEHYYHALIHLTFKLLGIYVQSQVQTSDGRADAIVFIENKETKQQFVFAFEFKLNGSADEAFTQIKSKGYLTPYLHQNKTCIGIGLNFSKEEKKVEKLVWEEIS